MVVGEMNGKNKRKVVSWSDIQIHHHNGNNYLHFLIIDID